MLTTWSLWRMANRATGYTEGVELFVYQTLNLDKTEVLHIGHQREELDIDQVGKKLTQGDTFVYLGGAVCGDGKTKRAIRR